MSTDAPHALNGADAKRCGDCRNWHRLPQDPMNLDPAAARGECREGPPQVAVIVQGQNVVQLCQYPQLPTNFVACAKFTPMLAISSK